MATITSIATAVPPFRATQETAKTFFHHHYAKDLRRASIAVLDKVLDHPSIEFRHFAVDDPTELVGESPDARVARHTRWAVKLSGEAALRALADAGVEPDEVKCLVVNTCTGYLCPGLTSYLIEKLGLSPTVRAYDLVGSGCGGALPTLEVGRGQLALLGGPILLVSVEICSATLQVGDDLSLIISNAIFGDGGSAVLLQDRPDGLSVIDSTSRHLPEQRDAIRFIYREGNLHNQLSPSLPSIIATIVEQTVSELLRRNGLTIQAVENWAFHVGGDKILTAIKEKLGLEERDMSPSRAVLRCYGNMSSATVWFSLKELLNRGVEPQSPVAMVTFGAGLSVHATLLRSNRV